MPRACLWVGNLAPGLTREELATVFRPCEDYSGTCLRLARRAGRKRDRGSNWKGLCTAFVEFRSKAAAEKAVEEFNGHKIKEGDEGISVQLSTKFTELPEDGRVDTVPAPTTSRSRSKSPSGSAERSKKRERSGSDANGDDDGEEAKERPKAVEDEDPKLQPEVYTKPYERQMDRLVAKYTEELPEGAKRTLLVTNIPWPGATDQKVVERMVEREISQVFRPFSGYSTIRLGTDSATADAATSYFCFVEFNSVMEAAVAQQSVNGYQLYPKDKDRAGIVVEFAKNASAESLAVERGADPRVRRARRRKRIRRRSPSPRRRRSPPRRRRAASPYRRDRDRSPVRRRDRSPPRGDRFERRERR